MDNNNDNTQIINITNIRDGWLDLYLFNQKFIVSYLTDVAEEIEKIFNIHHLSSNFSQHPTQTLYFDGEGTELYLTVRLNWEILEFIWEEYNNHEKLVVFSCHYDKFLSAWKELWNKIEDEYEENFKLK